MKLKPLKILADITWSMKASSNHLNCQPPIYPNSHRQFAKGTYCSVNPSNRMTAT